MLESCSGLRSTTRARGGLYSESTLIRTMSVLRSPHVMCRSVIKTCFAGLINLDGSHEVLGQSETIVMLEIKVVE